MVPRLHAPDLLALGVDTAVALQREILNYAAGLRVRLRAPRLTIHAPAWSNLTPDRHLEVHLAPHRPVN